MDDTIKFTKKVIDLGGSRAITINKELCEYLDIKEGDEISLMPDKGKHGKFISLWKKEEK